MRRSSLSYVIFFLSFMVFISTPGCVLQESPITGNRRSYAYTWQQEIQIGRDVDRQIVAQYGIYDNPELAAYVEQVSKAVLEHSHLRREDARREYRETEFTFRLLNTPIVNAFALPGGYIYVTRGLLTHLNNEAQLAVVQGHEITHVAARHASQRMLEQQIGSLILVGGAVLGQELIGVSAENIMGIGGMAAQLLFLQYSRDNERESDQRGVEYAAMAGYDAAEGAAFFTTLQRIGERAGVSLPTHLSSHPDPGDREQAIRRMAREWEDRGFTERRRNQEEYMNAINGMIMGDNPREGFVEDGVFYHPDLAFQFSIPSNWNVQNEASRVVVYQADQNAISILDIPEADSPEQAVLKFTSQEGITVESSESTTVNGLESHRSIATAQDQQGNQYRFLIQAIRYGDYNYRFMNYTMQSQWDTYSGNFTAMVNSFNELTDQEKLDTKPVRIEVITTTRTGTLRSHVEEPLPMGMEIEELAIINQVRLDETIPTGTMLKIPVQR